MPLGSTSPVTYASLRLSYPIFDAEFDPFGRGYLVVAGGGGESNTGVPNKITVIDVSSRESLKEVTDLDLSTDEDSPQSLASLTSKQGLITFVGVSSSVASQKEGKNEHFRSYDIEFPPRKKQKPNEEAKTNENEAEAFKGITLAGASSLFKPPTSKNPKTYQRVLKLSPVTSRETSNKRIGAIATADAAENEIVIFDATTFRPTSASVLARLTPTAEAEDLDIIEYAEGSFALAFCTQYDVYLFEVVCDFSKKTSSFPREEPYHLCTMPGDAPRNRLRSVRWITPDFLLLLHNGPSSGSAELSILRVHKAQGTRSVIVVRKKLPKSMGIAVRMEVCPLDADPASGDRQIVIAVAGQNRSIHVFTLDHVPKHTDPAQRLQNFKSFTVLDTTQQHSQSISKLAFTNFFPPQQSETSNRSVALESQYIQLASVSVGYTVSVESLALTSKPTSPSNTQEATAKKKTPSVRWVLSTSTTETLESWFGLVFIVVALLASAIALRMRNKELGPLTSIESQLRFILARGDDPKSSALSKASDVPAVVPEATPKPRHHRLTDLFHRHKDDIHHPAKDEPPKEAEPRKAIVVHPHSEDSDPHEVKATVHEDVESLRQQGAKPFHELEEHEKEAWKKRLSDAGHWSAEEGETVLKSIFFSQWAEIVGGAIRDAVL